MNFFNLLVPSNCKSSRNSVDGDNRKLCTSVTEIELAYEPYSCSRTPGLFVQCHSDLISMGGQTAFGRGLAGL